MCLFLGMRRQAILGYILAKFAILNRPETESIITHLASSILQRRNQEDKSSRLRILDLCTGSGCIPLLLQSLLSPHIRDLKLCGVDISPAAVKLAQDNLEHNVRLGHLDASAREDAFFVQEDIFGDNRTAWQKSRWDVIVSNPPYISPKAFNNTTSRSVRNYEPKIALVPHHHTSTADPSPADHDVGDMFYPRLLEIAIDVSAQVLLMEVTDIAQAVRVVEMVIHTGHWTGYEIWRDWPMQDGSCEEGIRETCGEEVRVRGDGNGRAVFAWKGTFDLSGDTNVS